MSENSFGYLKDLPQNSFCISLFLFNLFSFITANKDSPDLRFIKSMLAGIRKLCVPCTFPT